MRMAGILDLPVDSGVLMKRMLMMILCSQARIFQTGEDATYIISKIRCGFPYNYFRPSNVMTGLVSGGETRRMLHGFSRGVAIKR